MRELFACLISCTHLLNPAALAEDPYIAEIEAWRLEQEARLKAEDGWLSVVGLHWLSRGVARLGSAPSNDVLLPAAAPEQVGTITLEAEEAKFQPAPDVKITVAGKPFKGGVIHSDASGPPDILSLGDIRIILLKRGSKYAVRVKDNQSEFRSNFAGLTWYPVTQEWRIKARFSASPTKTRLIFDTIVGEQDVTESPGYVTFDHDGKTHKLLAAKGGHGELWIVFRDGTSGRTTATNARQLYTSAPIGDRVVIDFNKARNLPCAYIPYATCPIAPPQNRLDFPIPAGEQKYRGGH